MGLNRHRDDSMAERTVVLETHRLRFGCLRWDDLDQLYRFYSNPQIMRYFPGQVRSYEKTRQLLEGILDDYKRHGFGLWAAMPKADEEMVGRCGLIPLRDGSEAEVAWLFSEEYWGQGLGTESAVALVEYGLHALGLQRIFAKADPSHSVSLHIMEKAGMRSEGLNQNQRMVYSITRG